jgi:hypothetical protein
VVELLVAAGLLSVILTVLLAVCVPILRSWVRSDKRAFVQTQPALVVSRLREELRGADPESIVLLPGPGVAFVSFYDANGQLKYGDKAELLYQKRVAIYYRSDVKEVHCQKSLDLDRDPSKADVPLSTMDPALKLDTGWLNPSRPDARRLASGIVKFELEYASKKPVTVRVEAKKNEDSSQLETAILPLLMQPTGAAVPRKTFP